MDLLRENDQRFTDIVIENPDYDYDENRRNKRSNALKPETFYPTFLYLNLKVYLSPSWNVSCLIIYCSTYPSSIYSWSISHILEHAILC